MIGPIPICMDCRLYHPNDFEGLTCDAFPKGIPDEILYGDGNLSEPLKGQKNEVVFEKLLNQK